MATILKCKMCGGDIEVSQDMTVGTCLYCGSTMTLPHIDSEKKARLFNRANEYRLNNEFDKAYEAYKAITEEDEQEAEAYWGMILSEYGVEYVEDSKTNKRIPTCHRTIPSPVKKSTNYDLAIKYADIENRFMYQDEADVLDKIQKRIAAISSKQEQYDVFICYKETDDSTNERTEDSVLAQSIYDELTNRGINTFFSRVTLKDKLGEDYEPYIYSALKSATVMLVVATSAEHCDSTWVRNEWSRFIRFMSDEPNKRIIPVFKGMSVYELPDELSGYQSQDMDKIGAIQDLAIGINSILRDKDTTKKTVSEQDILNIVRDNSLKERQIRTEKITNIGKKVIKLAALVALIVIAIIGIKKGLRYARNEYFVPKKTYDTAVEYMNNENYEEAIPLFKRYKHFRDSLDLSQECTLLLANQLIDQGSYEEGINTYKTVLGYTEGKLSEDKDTVKNTIYQCASDLRTKGEYEYSIDLFSLIEEYQDSADMINEVKYDIAVKKAFEKAQGELDRGDFRRAVATLKPLSEKNVEGSKEQIDKIYNDLFQDSKEAIEKKDYDRAIELLEYLVHEEYSGAKELYDEAYTLRWDPVYESADQLYKQKAYSDALHEFKSIPATYRDVRDRISDCQDQVEAPKKPFYGRWLGHGNWWGDDMCFVIDSDDVSLAIGADGRASFSTYSKFDESSGKFIVKYQGEEYKLSVSGNTLSVRSDDPSAMMVGTYRRIGDN